jgi:hypothetical protein
LARRTGNPVKPEQLSDLELFRAMNAAREVYEEFRKEYYDRGLDKKPYCEFSRFKPSTKGENNENN